MAWSILCATSPRCLEPRGTYSILHQAGSKGAMLPHRILGHTIWIQSGLGLSTHGAAAQARRAQAERRWAGAPRPRVTCRGSWRARPARARPPAPRAPAARPAAGRRRPAGGPGAARAPRARARSAARPPGAHAAGARSAGARRSEEEGAPDCSLLLDAVCRGSRQALYWHHTDGDTAAQRPGFQELQRQSDQHGGRMAGGRTRGAGHFRGTMQNA